MGVKVDQMLHGYAHGHGLLHGSTHLSAESARLMLGLSDMSGPGMLPGFESYLTAYALVSEQIYVVARTWYAFEMRRPGCVWTHSLLIKNTDLGRIQTAKALIQLFRRPSTETADDYTEQLALDVNHDALWIPQADSDFLNQPLTWSVLWCLYARPEKPVYLLAKSADYYESAILQLWLQQWPQLRQQFAFCTGALANRTLRGKSFDLQVVPADPSPELRQDLSKGSVVDTALRSTLQDASADWVTYAIGDLKDKTGHRLRKIAWHLANGKVADRTSFPAVFQLASAVQRHPYSQADATDYLAAIAEASRSVRIPRALLTSMLDPQAALGISALEENLLEALATVPLPESISVDDLDLPGRIRRMTENSRTGAAMLFSKLIRRESITEAGNQILLAIAHELKPEDLESISPIRPEVLTLLIGRNPRLAASPFLWNASQYPHAEILAAVMHASVDETTLGDVFGAMLVSKSDSVAENAFTYGNQFVEPALQWLNRNGGQIRSLPKPWRRYFRSYTEDVVSWLLDHSAAPNLLILLASTLPADATDLTLLDLAVWLPLLPRLQDLNESERLRVAAFLFALAVRHCVRESIEFLRESFEIVYRAGAIEMMDYESWRAIEAVAPPLSYWRGWDKCERITAALLDRFIECDWQGEELLKMVKSEDSLRQLFGLSSTSKERKRFLKRTARIALEIPTMPQYRRIFEGYA